jgi:hypothetical protein
MYECCLIQKLFNFKFIDKVFLPGLQKEYLFGCFFISFFLKDKFKSGKYLLILLVNASFRALRAVYDLRFEKSTPIPSTK